MGNFYVNYTLRGPSQEAAANALTGRNAIVTPVKDGCVVVFDEQSDEQDTEVIADLAKHLSRECNCPVWAVLNHDDDVFWYQLHVVGELVDEYDSSPGYFDATEPSPPKGGDAQKLCSAFGASKVAEVDRVLRTPVIGGYLFAIQRHDDLVNLLGIPSFGVGSGYDSVAAGEETAGLEEEDLVRVHE